MNFYDVLKLMVSRGPYSEPEKKDMNAVITDLERMNTLGGLAKNHITGHDHCYDTLTGKCLYCETRNSDHIHTYDYQSHKCWCGKDINERS